MKKVITIHQTDLFRPHNDLDDHYDLACQFALAKMGYMNLKLILIEYPHEENIIQISSQLNNLTTSLISMFK